MSISENVGAIFGNIAEEHPDFPAIIAEDRTLSYRQLWDVVQGFTEKMRHHGVDETSLIAVNTQNMVVSLATLLASAMLGARYVVSSRVLADAKVLSPTNFFRSVEVQGSARVDFIEIDESWAQADNITSNTKQVSPDAPWLYLHTSGSTGAPKFFSFSQQIAYDRAVAGKIDFIHNKTRYLPLHKVNSRPFFVRSLSALLNVTTIVDSKDRTFWHRAGVNFVCGSPAQAIGAFDGYKSPHKFETLELGGASVSDKDLKRFLKLFDQIEIAYGASETSKTYANTCALDAEGALHMEGKPQNSALEIVDKNNVRCQIGEIGEVRVKNGFMINGYMNNSEPDSCFLDNGWFYPGDLARWGDNNALIILSRTDDIINLGGVKADALLIDMILQSVEGISKAVCFKNPKPNAPNELLAFVEFDEIAHRDGCIYKAKQACQEAVGIYFTPQRIHSIIKIPRTEKGAVDRTACQRILLDRIEGVHKEEGKV